MVDLFTPPRKDSKARVLRARRAPPALEFHTCCALADTLRRFIQPRWVWMHIPNGEHRSAATGARLKRLGVKPGVSDYLFISPDGRMHWLEMKRRGEKPTPEQADFAHDMERANVPCRCAWSYDEAVKILKGWGALSDRLHV